MNTNAQVQLTTLDIFRVSGEFLRSSGVAFCKFIPLVLIGILICVSIFHSLKSPGMFVILENNNNPKTLKVTAAKINDPDQISACTVAVMKTDKGILFDMCREVEAVFWMKETSFPLSAAFLDRKGKVLAVYNMKPFAEIQARPPSKFRYAPEAKTKLLSSSGFVKRAKALLPVSSDI